MKIGKLEIIAGTLVIVMLIVIAGTIFMNEQTKKEMKNTMDRIELLNQDLEQFSQDLKIVRESQDDYAEAIGIKLND